MKVYVITEFSCVDYDVDITTKVFANKVDAQAELKDRSDIAFEDAKDAIPEDDRIVDITENSYNVYMDGYASQWEVRITLEEMEVL